MSEAQIVTRIAPSPTGYMHIGTARTALFNWLYARGRGGKFLLRIEDTDRARSTPQATEAILKGISWLGLDHDGEIVSQFDRAERHVEVAHDMVKRGKAYKCFATQDEIEAFRETARSNGTSTLFSSPWRDAAPDTHPDAPFVVRVKAPREGKTVIRDEVQGDVTIDNSQLDDLVCLRSDGTPTYMLAVVVDDHDMGVTHVIRGDDHLTNAARQIVVYAAMDWKIPVWAHIPLIHGADGKKLSKRHGATGVEEYQALGYPAAGMRNYLTRLGWSHGDDEFFTDSQAIDWFDLSGIGKGAARFDTKKLEHLCGQHLSAGEDAALTAEFLAFIDATDRATLTPSQIDDIGHAMGFLKMSSKTFVQLFDKTKFIRNTRPMSYDEKASATIDSVSKGILAQLTPQLQNVSWDRDALEAVANATAEANETKFGKIAAPLRAALAGTTASPSVFDMMLVLGREETLARMDDAARYLTLAPIEFFAGPFGSGPYGGRPMLDDKKSATLNIGDQQVELPIFSPTAGPDVVDIRKLYAQAGVFTYDPGTPRPRPSDSSITYIDGDKGELWHRGYPIDQLAEKSHYLEVCYLMLYGELPDGKQLEEFENRVTNHTMVHEQMHYFYRGFRRDAHPMAVLVGVVGAMSAFYHDSTDINDPWQREVATVRLIAKMPTIAAMAYKFTTGQPFVYPRNDLDYASNFLRMCFAVPAEEYEVNPILARAMDRILTLHADHEQNASTSTVRLASSSGANPFACIAAGIACLWGPAHGGANQACLEMLKEIGTVDRIPEFIERAKDKNDPFRLMGFGHRVYKNFDPRAKVLKQSADEVLELLGVENNPILQVAKELERQALEDPYFVEKKLFPNVDFYSGIILEAMGFPTSMFTPIFAVSRTVGWISQWKEMIEDPSMKIGRPRQLYDGATMRDYVDVEDR